MTDYSKEHPESIELLFNHIAKNYDRANGWMSWNLHKRWNRALSSAILSKSQPQRYLDLCSGTGEIAFGVLSQLQNGTEAFLLDFSQKMLECAKEKERVLPLKKHAIHYIQADAQKIPLPDASIDAVTLAYGIRNVQNPQACIRETFRVLKEGGVCAILELTRPRHPFLRWGHLLYTKTVLPLMGRWIASDPEAYSYLKSSIQTFLSPDLLEQILREEGFQETTVVPLTGGIATLFYAQKPVGVPGVLVAS